MFTKLVFTAVLLLTATVTAHANQIEFAGFVTAWHCRNVTDHGCQLSKGSTPNNFVVQLNRYGVELRGEHTEVYDIANVRFKATYSVRKLDFESQYGIEINVTAIDSKGLEDSYEVIRLELEAGKSLSPLVITGRTVYTGNNPERVTPVVYFGEKGEDFQGRYL